MRLHLEYEGQVWPLDQSRIYDPGSRIWDEAKYEDENEDAAKAFLNMWAKCGHWANLARVPLTMSVRRHFCDASLPLTQMCDRTSHLTPSIRFDAKNCHSDPSDASLGPNSLSAFRTSLQCIQLKGILVNLAQTHTTVSKRTDTHSNWIQLNCA